MKNTARFVIMFVVLALAIAPLSIVSAQEDEVEGLVSVAGVYYQSAGNGSFADNGDGTYTLTLEGMALDITYIGAQVPLELYTFDLAFFSEKWALAEGLTTEAVLRTDAANIHLVLGSPMLDEGANTQSYVATVISIIPFEESKDEPEVPESFGEASLAIASTPDFEVARAEAVVAATEGIRFDQEVCNQLQGDMTSIAVNQYAASQLYSSQQASCNSGDASACAIASSSYQQMLTLGAQTANLLAQYHAAGCP